MRVLFLRRQTYGGLSTYAESLASMLPRFGVEAVIEDAESWIPNQTGTKFDPTISKQLKKTALDFDLVHALGYRSAWACAEAFGDKEAWVYSAYDIPKTTHPELIERLNRAQKGICSSYAVFNDLNSARAENLDVIYPSPKIEKAIGNARESLNLPAEAPIVATLTRIETNRGLDALLDSADKVWERVPNAHFLIGGTGLETDVLRAKRFDTAKPDQIHLPGRIGKPQDLYEACDLIVVPSRNAGFSLAAVEAMASGCALLVRSAGGLSEIVHEHVSGLVFNQDHELSDAIADALEMPITLEAIGNAARIRASEMFDLELNAERIAEVYRSVVK